VSDIKNIDSGFETLSTIQVRSAQNTDTSDIARIYNQHIALGGSTFDTQPWTQEFVSEQLKFGPPDAWFVAIESNRTVGWASIRRYSLRMGYRFTSETAIYLVPPAIGRGVGRQLQNRIDTHCRESEIHHAVAKVMVDNERSMKFHSKWDTN
jgi:phosphinothricin acetyltransferase